jgi:4-amino-4-deoxy-L-arabinose transferase-like glycosyltransferase
MRHYALLIVLCLAAFLPGIASLPPIDRDEPRFMQASKQMVESGDYIDIRFQEESRYKKPIGIYWLQTAAVALSGKGADAPAWVYRLVSILGAIIAVCATYAVGRNLFGKREGLIAAIGLVGVFGLAFEARIAKTDAMLLATAVLAQGALAMIYLLPRQGAQVPWWVALQFWIAQALAILIKGPIVPVLSLVTVAALLVFDRNRKWLRGLRPVLGVAIVAVIVAPWIVAISAKAGWSFWQDSLGKDMLGKVAGGQESHGFPPGYYVLTYSLFLWPFGAVAFEGGLAALRRFRSDPRLLFLLAWYVPWWIVCELMPTKLPHYVLPAYPALLLMMAWFLEAPAAELTSPPRWQVWLVRAAQFGVILVTVALAALAVGLPIYLGKWQPWAVPCGIAFLIAGWIGSGLGFTVFNQLRRVTGMAIASLVAFGLLATKVLPSLDPIWPSRAIADAFEANRPCPDSILVLVGYEEPSLVFLAGTSTLLTNAHVAAERLMTDACAVAAIDAPHQAAFDVAFAASARRPQLMKAVDGVNYSNGRTVYIRLYRMPPG